MSLLKNRLFLAAAILSAVFSLSQISSAEEITFASSDSELAAAYANQGGLRGIAIRYEFYLAANKETKDKIKLLADSVKNLHPIFVYGSNVDKNILIEIINLKKMFVEKEKHDDAVAFFGGESCRPALLMGVYATMMLNGDISINLVDVMCVKDSYRPSESWLREYVLAFWIQEKEFLKKNNYRY